MASNEIFKPEINLQEFSIVAAAIRIWELPDIREKMNRRNFNDALQQVLKQFDAILLPKKVSFKIREILPFIGEKMFYWHYHVQSDLGLDIQYTEKISWTNYGTIDEAKTFQLHWQNDLNLLSEMLYGLPALYIIACINCQEKFFSDNLNQMRRILKNYCGPLLNVPEDVQSMMSIGICCYIRKSKEQGCELFKTLAQSNDPEGKLFSECVSTRLVNGVKYFGKRVKGGNDQIFYDFAKSILMDLWWNRSNYTVLSGRREDSIKILIFLMDKMNLETRSVYLCKNVRYLFLVLVHIWPYNQSFLLKILNCSLPDMLKQDQEALLTSVFLFHKEYCHQSSSRKIVRGILGIILEQFPVELKKRMIIDRGSDFFKELICQSDFLTMEIVFNDPYVKAHKREIVTENIVDAFQLRFTETEFVYVKKFTEEYLTDDEKTEFKANFNNLKEVLAEGKFDLCVKLIDWKAQSEKERTVLKKGINIGHVFSYAISSNNLRNFLSIAEKLLIWQFDGNEEQIRSYKRTMRSEGQMTEDFIRKQFYYIWETWEGTLLAEILCTQILNFFFDGDEAKIFKKEKIAMDKNFVNSLTPQTLRTLDDLLNFCCLNFSESFKLKKEIGLLEDIDKVICDFAIRRSEFLMADAALDLLLWWDEDEKKEVIGKFLNSEKGIDLCIELLSRSYKFGTESVLIFLNSWVKPQGNFAGILSRMSDRLETSDFPNLKKLFKRLEEKECLEYLDIVDILKFYWK